jgi:hypothetical protein
MAFMQLNKPFLLDVARYFGVEVSEDDSKQMICAAMAAAEPPVTWEMYKEAFPDIEATSVDKPEQEKAGAAKEFTGSDEPVLIKMERGNPRYEIRGYKFTKEHPFLLVQRNDADVILKTFGFRVATTDEVKRYYA